MQATSRDTRRHLRENAHLHLDPHPHPRSRSRSHSRPFSCRHRDTARALLGLGVASLLALAIAGCASGPPRAASNPSSASSPDRDGTEANPPADLARVPDAEPRLEAIRPGGANKPYDVQGRNYVPITQDAAYSERGLASWYGRKFHGRRTASGEVYNMYAMTAAHPTLPIPSYARIRNPANGREALVRINDRGPFVGGRIVDLSYTAALKLDLLRNVAPVELQRITFDDIRTGAWRHGGEGEAVRVASATRVAAPQISSVLASPAPGSPASPLPASPLPIGSSPSGAASVPSEGGAVVVPNASTVSVGVTLVTSAASLPAAGEPVSVPTSALPEAVADAPAARAFTKPARGFWVQLGAFRARDGAEQFHQRVVAEMEWLSPLLAVFSDAALFRLQAGPYPSRDEARGVAERVRDGLKLVPVIVERR